MLNYLIERFDSVGIEERKAPKVGKRPYNKPYPDLTQWKARLIETAVFSLFTKRHLLVSRTDVQPTKRQPASQQHSLSVYFSRCSHLARHPDPSSVRVPSVTISLITEDGTFCSFSMSVTIATTWLQLFHPKDMSLIHLIQHSVVCFPHAGARSSNLCWYLICCVGTFHMASFRSWCALHTRTTRCSDRWRAYMLNY